MSRPRWAAGTALLIALAPCAAFAQDPPPPMLPGEVPAPPPEAPPAPSPDAPPAFAPAPSPGPLPAPSPPPASASPSAPPAEPPPPPEPPSRDRGHSTASRSVNGYVFPTPLLIDSAFLTTHVGLGAEVGHYWAFGQDPQFVTPNNGLNMSGTDIPYDLSMGYTTEYVSLGLAPWERVGLTLDASYTSYIASDINGAVLNGSQYAWDIRPGLRFRLLHSRSSGTQIALHLYGDFSSSSQVNPQPALVTIGNQLNACIMANNNLGGGGQMSCPFSNLPATTTSHTVVGGGGALSLAQAFNSTFGLQAAAALEVGYGWLDAQGSQINSTPVNFHVGIAPSINLGPSAPLSIMAEYLLTVGYEPTIGILPSSLQSEMTPDAGATTTFTHQFAVGLYYTGRSDFTVGGLFTATVSSSQTSSTADDSNGDANVQTFDNPPVRAVGAQVNARYFF